SHLGNPSPNLQGWVPPMSLPDHERCVLGIDVSKHWIDACLLPGDTLWHVENTAEALHAWLGELASLPAPPSLVVLEACGGLEAPLAALLARAALQVAVVNPKQVRDFAGALGQRAKSDPLDARLLARFAQAIAPTPRPLPDAQ